MKNTILTRKEISCVRFLQNRLVVILAKFKYRMQNILDIKSKLETQAKNEYAIANQNYLKEQEKLQNLILKRLSFEQHLKSLMSGTINIKDVLIAKNDVSAMKNIVRRQMMVVHNAEKNLDRAREKLAEVMTERKIHEKLKEKAFEDFKQDVKSGEAKEIDELVSFTYNNK